MPTMPIGIQRLNARHQAPNSRIVFIKPLPGPTSEHAQDFLERVAAICHPIMKAHHLSVMSLEEYEPNPDFIGRNFNAGEVIQLVLKGRSGFWMSFRSVVMVMMHELAHCVQMNHSKNFWEVRNAYAKEMRALWAKDYTGDGFWGRGKTLLCGEYENAAGLEEGEMPEHLCGGTFRSRRGRKRKSRGSGTQTMTSAEKKQRRIAKKFGVNGIKLGDDEEQRVKLEDGKRPKGKPRVAGSARGRELRAAAALSRFGQQVKEEIKQEMDESDDETEAEEDDYDDERLHGPAAVDLDGAKLLDAKGNHMVKVCEDEDADDVHVKEEIQELQDINDIAFGAPLVPGTEKAQVKAKPDAGWSASPLPRASPRPVKHDSVIDGFRTTCTSVTCPICSMQNEESSVLCSACSHVLDTDKSPGHWRCRTLACRETRYVNSADCGLCGICGTRKSQNRKEIG